ncbi:hypothetical protein NECAME_00063 [Necator americanus]|uniref:Low-density lipoprotein receptor domain class A n=1 Tax=Necator americanus TaxID=51031 RepID=W2TZU4_NECAM|nr:hypothetical protein NECAME_00063 [Necator americanus]ETN87204.1 hypothetical protein NECAME_00063 [Necator americanus]
MLTTTTLPLLYFVVPITAKLYRGGYYVKTDENMDRPECPDWYGQKYTTCPYPVNNRWKCIRHVDFCNGIADCTDSWDENPLFCQSRWNTKVQCPELFGQKQRSCLSESSDGPVKCIRWVDLCNGINDCPGGYDELLPNCVSEEEF